MGTSSTNVPTYEHLFAGVELHAPRPPAGTALTTQSGIILFEVSWSSRIREIMIMIDYKIYDKFPSDKDKVFMFQPLQAKHVEQHILRITHVVCPLMCFVIVLVTVDITYIL